MADPLVTPRLTLSLPTVDDHDDMTALWNDPAVYARLIGRPLAREEVWHRLLRYLGHWSVCGYGHWIARETAGGRYVGEVGIMDSRRATDPSFEGVPEVGWALIGHAQRRGFAAEALAALLAWADPRLPRTICIIDPANHASLRLAERMGYRRWAEGTYRDAPTLMFERSAPHPPRPLPAAAAGPDR